jgi:hypothetical protein
MYGNEYHAGSTFNPPIFHKLDAWSQGVNQLGDYFEIKRPTSIVVAPGSDMPYCALKFHPNEPAAGDGWPAQAANPAAYVSLMDTNQEGETSDRNTWHPILVGNMPVLLQPGWYINALPQMAYVGDQFDFIHVWPTTVFEWPEVMLMESNFPVEMNPYQFTTKAVSAGSTRSWFMPWLLTPEGGGMIASLTSLEYSKLLGVGGSNRTGTSQAAFTNFIVYVKGRTYPDTAIANLRQDQVTITQLADGARTNDIVERYVWFRGSLHTNDAGSTPAGVGYIIF